jgi:hypothetical protein
VPLDADRQDKRNRLEFAASTSPRSADSTSATTGSFPPPHCAHPIPTASRRGMTPTSQPTTATGLHTSNRTPKPALSPPSFPSIRTSMSLTRCGITTKRSQVDKSTRASSRPTGATRARSSRSSRTGTGARSSSRTTSIGSGTSSGCGVAWRGSCLPIGTRSCWGTAGEKSC